MYRVGKTFSQCFCGNFLQIVIKVKSGGHRTQSSFGVPIPHLGPRSKFSLIENLRGQFYEVPELSYGVFQLTYEPLLTNQFYCTFSFTIHNYFDDLT